MKDIVAKNLDQPDDLRVFLDGSKRSVVILDSVAIGRGEYLPGWKWSEHAGKQTGKASAAYPHRIRGVREDDRPDGWW